MALTMTRRTVMLEDHVDLLMAGDRHLVGCDGSRWIVTGTVIDEADGVLLTHSGERIVLGGSATNLHPGAEAAARARLMGECCYDRQEIDTMIQRLRQSCAG